MSAEQHRIDLKIQRSPLVGLDPADVTALRALLMENAEGRFVVTGRHAPVLRYFLADKEEMFDLDVEIDPGQEPIFAAYFRVFGDRPGVLRRFREGEMLVEVEGSLRRAAVILEHVAGDVDRWWVAWRLAGERVGRVGQFLGPWVEREGAGLDELGEPFAEWLRAPEIASSGFTETPTTPPSGFIEYGTAEMSEPVPLDAAVVADILGRMSDGMLRKEGVRGLLVFAFRGKVCEIWRLVGPLGPVSLDDFMRNVAIQGPLEAIAVVVAGVVQIDGVNQRCIMEVVECAGKRARRILPIEFKPGGGFELSQVIIVADADPGADAWIGVKPTAEMELTPMPEPGKAPIGEG